MVKVYNKTTNELLGRISEADLTFLVEHLEEESLKDQDYYIRRETIDLFAKEGASTHLLDVIRGGLRHDDAVEIRWERDSDSTS
jgi:hypothetical protein